MPEKRQAERKQQRSHAGHGEDMSYLAKTSLTDIRNIIVVGSQEHAPQGRTYENRQGRQTYPTQFQFY